MAGYFDETYYLKHKVDQLTKSGAVGPDGKPYTAETVKAAIAVLGLSVEDHYNQFGRGEQLNPNPYFNEHEYLTAKKALLAESDPSWATKSIDDVREAMAEAGMTPAEHYEKIGAFESNSKGVLLNPSNAFDANAYFAAKLVELQAAGEPGAEAMTVQQVIEAFKATGFSPVSHYEACGASEATATGTPLVQTVPSAQRVTTDPNRVDNVPGNYNPPTMGAASPDAVPAPVAKPADMGAKVPASVSPPVVLPSKPLLVPGDEGYTPPPPHMVDTNDKPVVPPSDATKGNWAQVNPDGSADLVSPDGRPAGTLPGGSLNPADPSNPIPDTPAPNPDPNPGGGGGGGGGVVSEYLVDKVLTAADDNTVYLKTSQVVTPHAKGIHLIDGESDVSSTTVAIAATDTGGAPAWGNVAKNLHNIPIFIDNVQAKYISVARDSGPKNASDQTLELRLKNSTIGNVKSEDWNGYRAIVEGKSGFEWVSDGGARVEDYWYKYDVVLTCEGINSLQWALPTNNGTEDTMMGSHLTVKGSGELRLDNVIPSGVQSTVLDATAFNGKLTMELFADRFGGGQNINLNNIKGLDVLEFGNNNLEGSGLVLAVGDMGYDSSNTLVIDAGKFRGNNNFLISGGTGKDIIIGSNGNNYITGGNGDDILTGGHGADFLVGNVGNDTLYAGANTSENGNIAGEDREIFSRTCNEEFLKRFNHWTGAEMPAYLSERVFTANGSKGSDNKLKLSANILEGREGDDTLVASTQKDMFLFHTGLMAIDKGANPGGPFEKTQELDMKDLGHDTIHGFELGQDTIMFMDHGTTGAGGNMLYAHDFSTGWKFEALTSGTGKLTIVQDAPNSSGTGTVDFTYGAGTTAYDPASNLALYIQSDATGDTVITIDQSILVVPQPGGSLTITLHGVFGIDTAEEIASLFGAWGPPAVP